MDLERLSGLLLGIVALATIGYLAKEIIAMRMARPLRMTDLTAAGKRATAVGKRAARAVAAHAASDGKPVNDHLIAQRGKVVAHTADANRPLRVRVGLELWFARAKVPPSASAPETLAVGTPVEVIAVEGSTLIVEARAPSNTEPPHEERT